MINNKLSINWIPKCNYRLHLTMESLMPLYATWSNGFIYANCWKKWQHCWFFCQMVHPAGRITWWTPSSFKRFKRKQWANKGGTFLQQICLQQFLNWASFPHGKYSAWLFLSCALLTCSFIQEPDIPLNLKSFPGNTDIFICPGIVWLQLGVMLLT